MNPFCFLLLASIVSTAHASLDCGFEKLKVSKHKTVPEAAYAREGSIEFRFMGADREYSVFEGPLGIYKNGKKRCTIPGGILEDEFYYSSLKNLLMTKTYSGSAGEFRVFDSHTCKPAGEPAHYDGNASWKDKRLVNEPACDAVAEDGNRSNCSYGQVFLLNQNTCVLERDAEASKKLNEQYPKYHWIEQKPSPTVTPVASPTRSPVSTH